MTTRGALRVGVVGLNARVQRQVLPSLAASPRAELTAVCSRDRAKAEEFAGPYDGCQPFDDYRAMIREGGLDAVFVMTPAEQHAEMSLAGLEAGLAVMCEKPLAASLAEARAMTQAATVRGARTAVNFTYRTSPGLRTIERLLRDEPIGELLSVDMAYLQGRALTLPGPFHDSLADLGAHAFDALLWWAGPVERVAAVESRPPALGTALTWSIAGRMASGAALAVTISRVAAGRGNAVLATLCGRGGALHLEFDVEAVRVLRAQPGQTTWQELPIPADLHLDYATFPRVHVDRLVGALRGEETMPDFAQGLRVQELIEAAEMSASLGRTISLPLE